MPASMMARTAMPSLVPQSYGRDDAVLRHVDQTARQVARVRGLQRGVGQTLAGAVRRVEVLEHREAFLEVRDDRALDDLARGLGHQAAHAGKLAHLRGRAARAGVRHHVDRVDLRVAAGLLVASSPTRFPSSSLRRSRSVDFDQASTTLLYFSPWVIRPSLYCCSKSLASSARVLSTIVPLLLRHDHVVLAERDAGLERVIEAERHDAVAEDHRLLLTAVAVDRVDHPGDFALRHELVHDVERNLGRARQHLAEQRAARRGLVPLVERLRRSRRRRPSGT